MAVKYLEKARSMDGNNSTVLDALGEAYCELGNIPQGVECLKASIALNPVNGYQKYFYMGQLLEGKESIQYITEGIRVARSALQRLSPSEGEYDEVLGHLVGGLCSAAELYLTDLCYDENAEQLCSSFIEEALQLAPLHFEALQSLASLRLSQQRPDDAKEAMLKSVAQWKDLEFEERPLMDIRINGLKMLLEVGELDLCADLVEFMLEEDDENVELWYLRGFCASADGDNEEAVSAVERALELLSKFDPMDNSELAEKVKELLQEVRAKSMMHTA
jgi:tetratricopeptide (TPR) repeat protein